LLSEGIGRAQEQAKHDGDQRETDFAAQELYPY
jgi:hypothetical protein